PGGGAGGGAGGGRGGGRAGGGLVGLARLGRGGSGALEGFGGRVLGEVDVGGDEGAEGADVTGHALDLLGRDALGDLGAQDPESLVFLVDADLSLGELARDLEAGLAQGEQRAA